VGYRNAVVFAHGSFYDQSIGTSGGRESQFPCGVQTMAHKTKTYVNERPWMVDAAPDTPLLYVLSNELRLKGPALAAAWRNADRVQFCSMA